MNSSAYEIHDGMTQYAAGALMHLECYLSVLGAKLPPGELPRLSIISSAKLWTRAAAL